MNTLSELTSERGNMLLCLNNFKYYKQIILKSGEEKWRCENKKCSAVLKTINSGENRLITFQRTEHTHDASTENNLQRQVLSTGAKRKAIENNCEAPRKIIKHALDENSLDGNNSTIQVRDVNYAKRNLYNARRKIIPKIPKNSFDVHNFLTETQCMTSRNENFLQYNSKENGIIIFCCKINFEAMCKTEIVYMDGTFTYCVKHFLQLFTIHGYLNGHYVPLCFCVLKDKHVSTYSECFKSINEICSSYGFVFEPKEIIIDFEKAIHNACDLIWPNAKLMGCRFHVTQSWWRAIQRFGLTEDYKKKTEVGDWLRICFGLVFLDSEDVSNFFAIELMSIKPLNSKLTQFADYILDTYITEEALFPPNIWAQCSAELNLTTNTCESFHSHLAQSFANTHPNIHHFTKALIDIQSFTYIKLNSINEPNNLRNSQSKTRQKYLNTIISSFKANNITTMQFVKAASNHYQTKF